MAEKAKKKAKAEMTAEIKSVDLAPEPPFFEAELELVRVNKFTARYRVVNPEGADVDINHIEVGRGALPDDVNFNFDFINSELRDDDEHAKAREKQAYFRSFMRLKMAIAK
jgi:hypothetical protein